MLPLGKLVARYGQGLPDYCSLCQSAQEDHLHVLKCTHPTRHEWRENFKTALVKQCHARRTDQTLTDILMDGVRSVLDATPFDESIYDGQYQTLLHDQRTIGWNHIFQARISTEWADLQQVHLNSIKPIKGQDGASWSKGILSFILNEWHLLWLSRNKSRHGNDDSEHATSLKTQALRELEILYQLRSSVLQRDHSLFHETFETHQSKPTHSIRQFLNTYRPLILQSAKDAKKKDLSNMKTMTQYYGAKAG